jgi:hypothetical protein
MIRFIRIVAGYAGLAAGALIAAVTSADAQAYVSTAGVDTNACTQAAPCATFQRASAVSTTIQCLNSGTFSTTTLTITGSLNIDCGNGNTGFMQSASGTNAITINTSSTAFIELTNLHLLGNGISQDGVAMTNFAGGQLLITGAVIGGFVGHGISFILSSGGRGTLQLTNTGVGNNNIGVSVSPASGQIASVTFTNVNIGQNAVNGLDLGGAGVIAGDLRTSVVTSNGVNGITGSSAGGVFFTVEGSTITDNLGVGIETNSAAAIVNVGASTIGGNGTGVKSVSGSLISFGNNQMSANGVNGSFTSTTPLQ